MTMNQLDELIDYRLAGGGLSQDNLSMRRFAVALAEVVEDHMDDFQLDALAVARRMARTPVAHQELALLRASLWKAIENKNGARARNEINRLLVAALDLNLGLDVITAEFLVDLARANDISDEEILAKFLDIFPAA